MRNKLRAIWRIIEGKPVTYGTSITIGFMHNCKLYAYDTDIAIQDVFVDTQGGPLTILDAHDGGSAHIEMAK